MLSNKIPTFFCIISIVFIFYSCGKKNNSKNQEFISKYEDPNYVLSETKSLLGDNVKFAYKEQFDNTSSIEIAAVQEIKGAKQWGIKFDLLKLEGDNLTRSFSTGLLNGSFKQCLVQKIKFPWFNHELIYYNSQDYFMGSAGGEIISYIINFETDKIYYAHLVIEKNQPISLYLSNNIDVKELRNFFISNFKRDYPNLVMIDKDIDINK